MLHHYMTVIVHVCWTTNLFQVKDETKISQLANSILSHKYICGFDVHVYQIVRMQVLDSLQHRISQCQNIMFINTQTMKLREK